MEKSIDLKSINLIRKHNFKTLMFVSLFNELATKMAIN